MPTPITPKASSSRGMTLDTKFDSTIEMREEGARANIISPSLQHPKVHGRPPKNMDSEDEIQFCYEEGGVAYNTLESKLQTEKETASKMKRR